IDENVDNRTFEWRTLEVANLNLTLVDVEGYTNESLMKGLSLTAVSNDGLGEVSLPLSNQSGFVSATLFPGDWNLELNYTDSYYRIRWVVEEYQLGQLSENQTVEADITLSRFVEVSGNVYWDFNEDGKFQPSEALENSEVKINSDDFESLNMTTELDGGWSFYVPAKSNYSVEVSRTGFTNNNSLTIEVANESISEDLDVSLDADNVSVSGKIEIQYGFSQNLIDAIISEMYVELIPAADEGYDRENVEISFEINEEGDIVWNSSVAPGKWVFHAEASDYLMVVYDAFEVEIIEGGVHNTTIKAGGYLPISTRWTDFSGDERDVINLESTNSTIIDPVSLTLTLNDAKWNISVSEEAEVWLLPAGSLQISGQFDVMEMGMEMEYEGDTLTGAYPPGIDEFGQLSPVTSAEAVVEFNRVLIHEVEFSVSQIISNDITIDYVEGEMINATAKDIDGDGILDNYYEIEVTLDLNYAGNLATENYMFSANVAGVDKDDWSVTLENGTNNFEASANMSFGISDSPSNGVLVFKIMMPSVEDSISYDTGHNVRIMATSDSGEFSSFDIKVHIPQEYSIDATAPEMVGMTYGGGTSAFDVSINNLGNGDDYVSFEIDSSELPDGWTVSQPMPRTIPANGTSDVGITVTMPQDTFTGEYTISVNVTSESGIVDVVEVLVLVSKAELRMDTPSLGGEALIR
ncbi:MAG: NEW3 domain-containing protein, partial [Candidatus Thermoplasmatota archaeon]|nr:NEW3 domain-containing protein [Candidatus Thermoplasmatota archaeon]